MNTTSDTPISPPPPPDPVPAPPPRRFERSSSDRVIGGVCGGLGRYFGIDSTLVRIGFVALALLGGTGLIVYAAALLLVPADGEAPAAEQSTRDKAVAAAIAVSIAIAVVVLGSFGVFFAAIGGLFPIALLALAGLVVYWFVSGDRATSRDRPGEILRRALLGIGLLAGCCALAVASFFATGLGGGVVVAGLVIAAGAGLVAGAFVGGARWLVLPALAIALPLAFVSAAGIDLHGGFGDRLERPGTPAELRDGYRIGAGQLVVDLRDLKLPAGDHPLSIDVGAGHALVLVPDDVCVASRASVGIGGVTVFDRDGGGIDVTWNDGRRASGDTPRLVVDSEIGLGLLEVRHHDWDHRERWTHDQRTSERNAACSSSTRAASGRSGASSG